VFPPCPEIVDDSSKIRFAADPISPISTLPVPFPIFTTSDPEVVSILNNAGVFTPVLILQALAELVGMVVVEDTT
jgi:hypothetical protein